MNSLPQSASVCKIKSFCHKLCDLQLKSDYDIKMSIYRSSDANKASSTHSMSGSCKCRIVKLIGIAALIWLVTCAVCAVCSCMRK